MKETIAPAQEIQLINGHFSPRESIELLTKMIHVKIRFHEDRIQSHSDEEDTKMREARIKLLQKQLYDLRQLLENETGDIALRASIHVELPA